MTFFRDFTTPLRELFAGNLLLLFCSLFYLAWWVAANRSNASGGPYLTAALITGVVALALMSGGINTLSQNVEGLPVRLVLLGSVALFFIMLLVTTTVFHRIVTSELLIIHIWAALELSAIAVLYGIGRFGVGRAVTLAALVVIALAVGLVCYVLHYRLAGATQYWNGMFTVTADALVMMVFLGVLAGS
jgi:hypothetical protein